jgi:hypothetical protein
MDQANYLSAVSVYEKLGMPEKVREYSEMYKVSVRSMLGKEANKYHRRIWMMKSHMILLPVQWQGVSNDRILVCVCANRNHNPQSVPKKWVVVEFQPGRETVPARRETENCYALVIKQ